MKIIALSKGKETIVSDEDYEFLSQWKWCYGKRGYATRTNKRTNKHDSIHRLVMERLIGRELASNEICDHINRNRLDNRRDNLRLVTLTENNANRGKTKGCSSIYKGVCKSITKYTRKDGSISKYVNWIAYIGSRKNRKNLGVFPTEKEAAIAYNIAALKTYGEFAALNNV